jgi:hypothetical protein
MNSTAVVTALDAAFGGLPVEFGVYMLVLGSVLLLLVFGSGRVCAALLSALVRRLWGAHYYFKVESVTFALLGGRIVFSELVYSTQNTTIRIVDGTITLRWWLYETRSSLHDSALKPCRLHVHLGGVEFYLVNNVGRYKLLRRWLEQRAAAPGGGDASVPLADVVDPALIAVPAYFRLFPTIGITLHRAALLIGNPELPAFVLIESVRGGGVYACEKAPSAHDGYKWVVGVQLAAASVAIVSNAEFLRDEELVAVDETARKASERARALGERFRDFLYRISSPTFMSTRAVGAVPRLVERRPRVDKLFEDDAANLRELDVIKTRDLQVIYSVDANGWWPADHRAQPSARDDSDGHGDDGAGERTAAADDDESASGREAPAPAAGELPVDEQPPEWSIRVDATGAQFAYGPWADRQRALISRFFFPLDYKPLERVRRAAGKRREHEALDVTLNLIDEFGIRVPFRTAAAMAGTLGARDAALALADADAVASLLIAGRDAVVRYVAPMFLNARHGHRTTCRTDASLRTTQPLTITTSLRSADAPLLRANGLNFRLAMHQQAAWNAENLYAFRIRLGEPRIFVTDVDVKFLKQMAADWVLTTQVKRTVELGDFVPTLYALDIAMSAFRIHINTNEMNVVAAENSFDDNSHLLLTGPRLRVDVSYPALLFGAVATTVTVRVRAPRAQIRHLYAEHHTARLFSPGGPLAPAGVQAPLDEPNFELRRDGLRFITLQEVDVTVAYKYHHEVRAGWRDSMHLTARAAHAELIAHGHFLRHMLYWLDNFLGAARKRRTPARWRDIWSGAQPATPRVYLPENEFEMAIDVDVDRVQLLLPSHLYNLENAVRGETTKFHLGVQYVALFIDIVIRTEPIHLRVPHAPSPGGAAAAAAAAVPAAAAASSAAAAATTFRALDLHSRSGLCVSGLHVRVHYLFGPAPRELTYQRIISINIGSVTGHVLPPQLPVLSDGLAQLGMHFKDHDNSVTWDYFPQEVPYHTSVRVKIARVHLHVWGGASVAELLVQDGVHIAVDDLRRRTHDVSVDVLLVGGAGVTCLVPKTAPAFALAADWRHWREVGRLCVPRTSVVASLGPPVDAAATQRQIDYLQEQDRATRRIWWLWYDAPPDVDAAASAAPSRDAAAAAAESDAAGAADAAAADDERSLSRSGRRSASPQIGAEPSKPPAEGAAPAPVRAMPSLPTIVVEPAIGKSQRAALTQSDASGRRVRSGTVERLRSSSSQLSVTRSRANSEADVFGTPEASIDEDDADDEFGSVDDDVAGFIQRAAASPRRSRRMTAQQVDVARSIAMVTSMTRSMESASAPLVPPVAASTRSPSPRRDTPPVAAAPRLAKRAAVDDDSESDSWWRENTTAAQQVRDGVYAPLFRLLASQRPLLRRAQLDELALDSTGVGFEGADAAALRRTESRGERSAFVHERDGVHEFLRRQRALADSASAFGGADADSSDDESDTALSESDEPIAISNPTDIANLHELIGVIRASRDKKARRKHNKARSAEVRAAEPGAGAPAPPSERGYTRHDVASNTATARVVVDLADLVEVILTPLFLYAVDDWLALLSERQASIDSVLDSLQRGAIEAATPAINRAIGDKSAPPHDAVAVAVGVRGVHVSLVQSARVSASATVPIFAELLLQRVRVSADVCFRSFVGANSSAAAALPPRELCHAHVGASIDGVYGCARQVARNRRAISGMRGVLPALLDEARARAGASYVGERLALENEWSRAAPALLLLVCVPPARMRGTFVGPGARRGADVDGVGALTIDVRLRSRLLMSAAAGAPVLACARLWAAAFDRAAERATAMAEIERLRLAAVVEGIVLGRVAAHKRQRAASQADLLQPQAAAAAAFDFESLVLLRRPDAAAGALDERYRFRLHPVALVRREALADVARLRECLSLMPPRRRQAIDVLLGQPLQLLSDAPQLRATGGAPAAGGAPHRTPLADLAEHNTQVVARCLARYRAFVDAGTKAAPAAVQELVARPVIRRCFAPPLAAARAARKEQLARQPDHTPQLSGVGRALFAALGRDGSAVLPPRSSFDLRVTMAGGDVFVQTADGSEQHNASSVLFEPVHVRAAIRASLDSCRNAHAGVKSVFGLLRVDARWHAEMGKVSAHLSNAALRFAAGVLEAAAVWDRVGALDAAHALPPPSALRDSELPKSQSRRHKAVMIDTNPVVRDAPPPPAAAAAADATAAVEKMSIEIDELDSLLPPHLVARRQATAATHVSPHLAAGVDESAPVALLTDEANLTENRYEMITLQGIVQLPAIVASTTVGESAAAAAAGAATAGSSGAAPVAFDARLRLLPVVVSAVRHYGDERDDGDERATAFLLPGHTNVTLTAAGALLEVREGRVDLASVQVSPITVSASRREQSASDAVRAAKPFISAAALASPTARVPGEEQFSELLLALDQEPQRAAVAAHVRGVHARVDASRIARLAGVFAVLDEALETTKASSHAAAPATTAPTTTAAAGGDDDGWRGGAGVDGGGARVAASCGAAAGAVGGAVAESGARVAGRVDRPRHAAGVVRADAPDRLADDVRRARPGARRARQAVAKGQAARARRDAPAARAARQPARARAQPAPHVGAPHAARVVAAVWRRRRRHGARAAAAVGERLVPHDGAGGRAGARGRADRLWRAAALVQRGVAGAALCALRARAARTGPGARAPRRAHAPAPRSRSPQRDARGGALADGAGDGAAGQRVGRRRCGRRRAAAGRSAAPGARRGAALRRHARDARVAARRRRVSARQDRSERAHV